MAEAGSGGGTGGNSVSGTVLDPGDNPGTFDGFSGGTRFERGYGAFVTDVTCHWESFAVGDWVLRVRTDGGQSSFDSSDIDGTGSDTFSVDAFVLSLSVVNASGNNRQLDRVDVSGQT